MTSSNLTILKDESSRSPTGLRSSPTGLRSPMHHLDILRRSPSLTPTNRGTKHDSLDHLLQDLRSHTKTFKNIIIDAGDELPLSFRADIQPDSCFTETSSTSEEPRRLSPSPILPEGKQEMNVTALERLVEIKQNWAIQKIIRETLEKIEIEKPTTAPAKFDNISNEDSDRVANLRAALKRAVHEAESADIDESVKELQSMEQQVIKQQLLRCFPKGKPILKDNVNDSNILKSLPTFQDKQMYVKQVISVVTKLPKQEHQSLLTRIASSLHH